ncbi:hypothetical protein P43SY_002702 [Pythium insidiosum]|uniref:Uncharacterized protein n=1 Tax=Pythium insidiosum TaxID=114742 RepID=A0AAD5MCU6_PYTIN|nr:hypothetical protein P43SY_002702 [Pythium insidiosum]KAJ0412830.1 hypothetical protein ATCC90586_002460 [Pythium insidiosum]
MSLAPFLVGVAVGGIRYGVVKYQLQEREDVVFYSVDQVKESFQPVKRTQAQQERYVPLRSREHEYYTYVREGWNAKVFAFRDSVVDLFRAK